MAALEGPMNMEQKEHQIAMIMRSSCRDLGVGITLDTEGLSHERGFTSVLRPQYDVHLHQRYWINASMTLMAVSGVGSSISDYMNYHDLAWSFCSSALAAMLISTWARWFYPLKTIMSIDSYIDEKLREAGFEVYLENGRRTINL